MRRRWSGLDTNAKLGVIGIVVALIGALPAYIALRPKGSNISISAVQVSTKDILEDWENLDGEKGTDKVTGSVVDITLENRGDAPGLITSALATFRQVKELEECNIAGGEVAMSKRYDIKVPIDPQFQKAPVPIEHSMRFEVASNDYDRLGLTIGPERTFWAGWPWFYELDVALKEGSGKRHEIKRIFLLENIEEQWKWVDTARNDEVQCLREQASFLQRAVETSGYHSPELLAYNKGLQDYLASISA